jgi:DNA-directed RNA polymerase subunit M/transcription elongation factor TFIIS
LVTIYEFITDFRFVFNYEKYARQVRTLSTHINRNPKRFIRLDPCFVATMNAEEMGHDLQLSKKRKAQDTQEDIFHGRGETQCWKCKGFDVTYYELQIRGSDEPATQFFTCHTIVKGKKCNNRWKH